MMYQPRYVEVIVPLANNYESFTTELIKIGVTDIFLAFLLQ